MPPAELTSYALWCDIRGVAPYGHVLAVAQWGAWTGRRQEWARAHGADEDELGPLGDAPWDDAI